LAATAQSDLLDELNHLAHRMGQGVQHQMWRQAQRLDRAAMKLARPAQALGRQRQALTMAAHRMQAAAQQQLRWPLKDLAGHEQALRRALAQRLSRERDTLRWHAQHLQSLDPARVLQRGYAWLQDGSGQALTHAAQASVGQSVIAVMQDGHLGLTVADTLPQAPSHAPSQAGQ
jgi:exodeoxyribonuclease VII large subunit